MIIKPFLSQIIVFEEIHDFSIVCVNSLDYVLASNQFYKIKGIVFKVEATCPEKLTIRVFKTENEGYFIDKDIEITKDLQYIKWFNRELRIVSNFNKENGVIFKRNQKVWTLTADYRLV